MKCLSCFFVFNCLRCNTAGEIEGGLHLPQAWSVGRGPLAQRTWTAPQFAALYALPILPAAPPGGSQGRRQHQPPTRAAAAGAATGAAAADATQQPSNRRRSARLAALQQRPAAADAAPGPMPAEQGGGDGGSSLPLLLRWAAKLALVAVCVFLLSRDLPSWARSALYTGAVSAGSSSPGLCRGTD